MRRFGIGWIALLLLLALVPPGCAEQAAKARQREAWEQYMEASTTILKEANKQALQSVIGLTGSLGSSREERNAAITQAGEKFAAATAQALERIKALKPPKGLEEVHQRQGEMLWILAESARLRMENDRQNGSIEQLKQIDQWYNTALSKAQENLSDAYLKAIREWKKLGGTAEVERKYFR